MTLYGTMIDVYPVIGEFCYTNTKMISVLMFDEMNRNHLDILGGCQCSPAAVKAELHKIAYARDVFKINRSYAAMCKAFLSCNSMSMVTYPVGQHQDQFHQKSESIENKILFVIPDVKHGIGRGGSMLRNRFVFALVDWTSAARTTRRFYVNHSIDMGLGPAQPKDAQRRLTEYFNQNTSQSRMWRRQYQQFITSGNRNRSNSTRNSNN